MGWHPFTAMLMYWVLCLDQPWSHVHWSIHVSSQYLSLQQGLMGTLVDLSRLKHWPYLFLILGVSDLCDFGWFLSLFLETSLCGIKNIWPVSSGACLERFGELTSHRKTLCGPASVHLPGSRELLLLGPSPTEKASQMVPQFDLLCCFQSSLSRVRSQSLASREVSPMWEICHFVSNAMQSVSCCKPQAEMAFW